MNTEEMLQELDRCGSDIEYMLRTYVKVRTDDGARPLTEEEVAASVVRARYPNVVVTPKRGYYGLPPWTSIWSWLASNRPLLPAPVKHYQP